MLHQYTRIFGHPRLVKALAKFYSKLICSVIDEKNEVITTIGAYEELHAAIMGHTDVGDEHLSYKIRLKEVFSLLHFKKVEISSESDAKLIPYETSEAAKMATYKLLPLKSGGRCSEKDCSNSPPVIEVDEEDIDEDD
ncbi:unnamed protein product [Diabrotica balteata]|uniref:Uncharacterized protein n=1 Tax=Diabrotica balteata TaxID=107213 RepID=A0A9N9XB91_DIABA|nr:unnamed protein product [Diabrotica balteata]